MADAKKTEKPAAEKEGVKVHVPVNIIRWIIYSGCFYVLLIPFTLTLWQNAGAALITGWFAGLLNGIKNERK
jgi:hypothetical protein